jgi:hypothetical protein
MKEKLFTLEEALEKYKENTRRYDFEQSTLPFWYGLKEGFKAFWGYSPRKYRILDKQRMFDNLPEDERDYHWRW